MQFFGQQVGTNLLNSINKKFTLMFNTDWSKEYASSCHNRITYRLSKNDDTHSDKISYKVIMNITSHLKHIVTLPCKILLTTFENLYTP